MSWEEFLRAFPQPAMVVDGGLQVIAYSRRLLSIFGRRFRLPDCELRKELSLALAEDQELGDQLTLAIAQLTRPGDETHFTWKRQERIYAVAVGVLEEREAGTFLVSFADITAHVRSEEILLKARRYLEQILDDIPLGVIVLNQELRITSINRQQLHFLELLGIEFTLIEGIGATLEEVLPEVPGREWQELAREVIRRGERLEAAKKTYPLEQGELVLATVLTPLREPSGQSAGVILICEDVTAQTRLERELIRVEKLATIGQMVITINHEINNPLSIISANAQTLRLKHRELDEKALEKLRKIEAQVRRIAEVTERLRRLDEVVTSEYIASGPEMIEVWRAKDEERGR